MNAITRIWRGKLTRTPKSSTVTYYTQYPVLPTPAWGSCYVIARPANQVGRIVQATPTTLTVEWLPWWRGALLRAWLWGGRQVFTLMGEFR